HQRAVVVGVQVIGLDHHGTPPETRPADPPEVSEAGDANPRVKTPDRRLRSVVVQADHLDPDDNGPLVSEDELAMLLGDPITGPGSEPGPEPEPERE
ncbi:MAG: hypothetical protein AAFX76_00165, partial [Planctomycetota bacterium]